MLCIAAEIVVVPAATPFARPALEMLATPALEEDQVTWLVTSLWLPSLYIPVAENCSVAPTAAEGLVGETSID
jgi:hypothetical protein